MTHAVGSSRDRSSQPVENKEVVAGAVVGVMVFVLLAAGLTAVPLLVVIMSKRHRKKQLQRMQLDIIAV